MVGWSGARRDREFWELSLGWMDGLAAPGGPPPPQYYLPGLGLGQHTIPRLSWNLTVTALVYFSKWSVLYLVFAMALWLPSLFTTLPYGVPVWVAALRQRLAASHPRRDLSTGSFF